MNTTDRWVGCKCECKCKCERKCKCQRMKCKIGKSDGGLYYMSNEGRSGGDDRSNDGMDEMDEMK